MCCPRANNFGRGRGTRSCWWLFWSSQVLRRVQYIWFAKKSKLEKRNQCYANTLSIFYWRSVTVAKAQWRLTLTFWAASVVGATGSGAVWSLNASEFRWLEGLNSGRLDLFWQDLFNEKFVNIWLSLPLEKSKTLDIRIPTQLSPHSSLFLMLVSLATKQQIHAEQLGSFSFRYFFLFSTPLQQSSTRE